MESNSVCNHTSAGINKIGRPRSGDLFHYEYDYKQLLDEVFVISRIIKVEIRVISGSRRLKLITLTETLIILDITKTEYNNYFIIH